MNLIPKTIIEKYKKWDYVDNHGFYIWTNKYGDIIKSEDCLGNPKLLFNISDETIQNLHAYYGVDVETELATMLAEELTRVINENMIQQLILMVQL